MADKVDATVGSLTITPVKVKVEKKDNTSKSTSSSKKSTKHKIPSANPTQPKPLPLVKETKAAPEPPAIDFSSVCGLFGWTTVGKINLPFILRGNTKVIAVRMVELRIVNSFLTILPQSVFTCTNIKSYFITENEAKLLNEINFYHCDYQFGKEVFTTKDVVVLLSDTFKFYEFLETCKSRLKIHGCNPNYADNCGFVVINGTIVPYVKKDGKKFLPLSLLPPNIIVKQENETMDNWDLSYLEFLSYIELLDLKKVKVGDALCVKDDTVFSAQGVSDMMEWWPNNLPAKFSQPHSNQMVKDSKSNINRSMTEVKSTSSSKGHPHLNSLLDRRKEKSVHKQPKLEQTTLRNFVNGQSSSSVNMNAYALPYSRTNSTLDSLHNVSNSVIKGSYSRPTPQSFYAGGSTSQILSGYENLTQSQLVNQAMRQGTPNLTHDNGPLSPRMNPYASFSPPYVGSPSAIPNVMQPMSILPSSFSPNGNVSAEMNQHMNAISNLSRIVSGQVNAGVYPGLSQGIDNEKGTPLTPYPLLRAHLSAEELAQVCIARSPTSLPRPHSAVGPSYYPTPPQSSPLQVPNSKVPSAIPSPNVVPVPNSIPYSNREFIDLCSPPPSPDIRNSLTGQTNFRTPMDPVNSPLSIIRLDNLGSPEANLSNAYQVTDIELEGSTLSAVNSEPFNFNSELLTSLSDAVVKLFNLNDTSCEFVLKNVLGVKLYENRRDHLAALKQHGVIIEPGDSLVAVNDLLSYMPQLKYMFQKTETRPTKNSDSRNGISEYLSSKKLCVDRES